MAMNLSDKNDKRTQVGEYIIDRIKKLTEALYRVSDLYSDQEPLKWALRENAIYLYDKLMSVMDMSDMMSDRKQKTDLGEIISSFSQMAHKLDLASLGGFISDINFEILKKEYKKLKEFIEEQKDLIIYRSALENLSFAPQLLVLDTKKEKEDKGHKGQNIISDKTEDRKQKILNFLKNNDKKTIKEISAIFEGISEKSVQRDLAELVRSGYLEAEGEKRWRVYFLFQNIIDKSSM